MPGRIRFSTTTDFFLSFFRSVCAGLVTLQHFHSLLHTYFLLIFAEGRSFVSTHTLSLSRHGFSSSRQYNSGFWLFSQVASDIAQQDGDDLERDQEFIFQREPNTVGKSDETSSKIYLSDTALTSRQYGKTHQEPLGQAHHPDSGKLYVDAPSTCQRPRTTC